MERRSFSGNPLVAAINRLKDLTYTLSENPGDVSAVHGLRQAIEKTERLARELNAWEVVRYGARCSAWSLRDLRDPSILHRLRKMVNQLLGLAKQAEAADFATRAPRAVPEVDISMVSGLQHGML